MEVLSTLDIVGAWIAIFLTLSVFSFLYDDNPIYKAAEHIFMGVSIGYGATEAYWNVLKPNLFDKLAAQQWLYLIPLCLACLLMLKATRKYAWLARVPIAFLVAAYAALKVTGEATGSLMIQVQKSIPDMASIWQKYGYWSWQDNGAGILSSAFLVIGLMACLIHFYFSEIPKELEKFGLPLGIINFFLVLAICLFLLPIAELDGKIVASLLIALCVATPYLIISPYKSQLTRFGVLILMLSFGASFGFTVMGRISLAIGRAQHLLGGDIPAQKAAQIQPKLASLVCLVVIIAVLTMWKIRQPKQPNE